MITTVIKRLVAKYLGFWALPGESYAGMIERHEKEIEIFQSHCRHKRLNFDLEPFAVCANCLKVVRQATPGELQSAQQERLRSLTQGLDEATLQAILGAEEVPIATSGFYTNDGTPI